MREILNYPQVDRKKLEKVKNLVESIAASNGDCSHTLSELGHITGKNHTQMEFAEYWGWTDLDTLAEKTLAAEPPCIRDLTKDEIKEIVSIIKKCMVSLDDNKAEYYMELLHKSLPLTDVVDYIELEEDEETIVNHMLRASSSSVIAL